MRRIPLFFLLFFLSCTTTSRAELRIIGVLVNKDSQSKTRVSIYSDVDKENKADLAMKDALPIIRDAEGWGSVVKIGVVVRDVPLDEYLPLLAVIAKNTWLDLAFVEAEKPDFIHSNIKKRIEATQSKPEK